MHVGQSRPLKIVEQCRQCMCQSREIVLHLGSESTLKYQLHAPRQFTSQFLTRALIKPTLPAGCDTRGFLLSLPDARQLRRPAGARAANAGGGPLGPLTQLAC
jgi:hypothetical protein